MTPLHAGTILNRPDMRLASEYWQVRQGRPAHAQHILTGTGIQSAATLSVRCFVTRRTTSIGNFLFTDLTFYKPLTDIRIKLVD